MTTKTKMIETLKSEFPTLRVGDEESGYTDLTVEQYEATIEQWADNRLAKEAKLAATEAQKLAKADLLTKLGITAEEATLLLG